MDTTFGSLGNGADSQKHVGIGWKSKQQNQRLTVDIIPLLKFIGKNMKIYPKQAVPYTRTALLIASRVVRWALEKNRY